jgi:hypothetical protein
MSKDEALRLAIESLCCVRDMVGHPDNLEYIDHQIAKIEAALEAKDEPVACKECHLKDTVYDLLDDLKVANLKLSVRSQRTWIGLTDEDFQPAVQKAMVYYGYKPEHSTLTSGAGFYELVRAIEAKLKEKNT